MSLNYQLLPLNPRAEIFDLFSRWLVQHNAHPRMQLRFSSAELKLANRFNIYEIKRAKWNELKLGLLCNEISLLDSQKTR